MVNGFSSSGALELDLLAAVFRVLPDAVLVFDQAGRARLANTAAVEFFDGDPVNWSLTDLVQADAVFSPLQSLLDSPSSDGRWTFEVHSDRRSRDYTLLVSAWEAAFDEQPGYVALLHDVTGLYDRLRFQDEMLRLASHDLRSPLAMIIGYCDLLFLDIPPELPVLLQYAEVIRQASEKMKLLLDSILHVELVRSVPLELRQSVNPVDLIGSAVDNMRLAAAAKHQQLMVEMPPVLDQLVADPALLQEAMENLIGNAIKYTPDGGQIQVRARCGGERFEFEVEDNGIGIGAEHLPRIFESFYRARQEGTEEIDGTGLGLSLVKAVVERHQGRVWVTSAIGQGSRFGFWLPLQTQKD